jgi:hypothetical protein
MPNEFPPAKPYVPALTTEPSFRIAHALEFIAAQLAQINAKMGRSQASPDTNSTKETAPARGRVGAEL